MFLNRCLELAGGCTFNEQPSEADWRRVETEIGLRIPDIHMQFVSAFGSGTFGEDLYVQNPKASGFCRLGRERLLDYASSHALLLKDVKRNVYPKSNLVLIAATTSRNDFFLDLGAPQKSENVWFFDLGMLRVIDLRMPFPEFVYKLYVNELDYEWAKGLRNSIWIGDSPFFKPITTP